MRSALFWDITQRREVTSYRHFFWDFSILEDGTAMFLETSVRNCHSPLLNILEEENLIIPPSRWRCCPTRAMASSFLRVLDHTQLAAETSTWQHTTIKTYKHPCPRWDSNPRSQQASGRRPTPQTARPLGQSQFLFASPTTLVAC